MLLKLLVSRRMILRRFWSYQEVSNDIEDEQRPSSSESLELKEVKDLLPYQNSRFMTTRAICIAIAAVLTAVVIAFLSFISLHLIDSPHNQLRPSPCGNTSAEALLLGCSFNQLLWAWLPPNCPHYANDEFLAAESWTYYVDSRGKEKAVGENWSKAMDNQISLWGERGEHLSHCVYMFVSVGQVIRDGTPYPPRLGSYEHLNHCANILLEALRDDKTWHKLETSTGRVSYEEYC